MTKKKDIPKSQLRRKFPRCSKCNSANIWMTGKDSFNDDRTIMTVERKCIDCGLIDPFTITINRKHPMLASEDTKD